MNGDEKLIAMVIGGVVIVALSLVGWGVLSSMNSHNFDVVCLNNKKTISYQSLPGQSSAYKVCK